MFERIREKIKTKVGVPIEVEKTVIPIEYYRELEAEVARLKNEIKKLKEENMELRAENERLKAMALPEEDNVEYCYHCGWHGRKKIYMVTTKGLECIGKYCMHCGRLDLYRQF